MTAPGRSQALIPEPLGGEGFNVTAPGRSQALLPQPLGAEGPLVDAASPVGAAMHCPTTASARHARRQPGHAERVAAAVRLLREASAAHGGRIVQATSLGVEGMVITDLIARHGLAIPVATLDTGLLHEQTLALIPRLEQRYGIRVERHSPAPEALISFVERHGALAMRQSVALRQACCELRKLAPMRRLLAGRDAWVTGLRREQSEHRRGIAARELDADGRHKFYPLHDWTLEDVWQYVADHDVPYNELHDRHYESIGCAPCTRAVAPGEDQRAGRWWWEQQGPRECGLHARPGQGRPTVAAGGAGEPRPRERSAPRQIEAIS
jgi:phosphoadenosine phosphosulfate reductase